MVGANLSRYDNDKRAIITSVCWSIWKARNEVVWQKKYTRVFVVIARAKQYLEQWRFAQNKVLMFRFPNLVEGDGRSVWVQPQGLTIKVSVDAATFKSITLMVLV